MILLNGKKQEITLKCIFENEEKINKFIIKKHLISTFISEEKIIYIYLNKKINFNSIFTFFKNFVKTNKYNINIDIYSFEKYTELNNNIFCSITESLFLNTNKKYTLKTINENNENYLLIYNLIYKNNKKEEFNEIKIKTESINFAKKLQDMPPNLLYPSTFVEKIIEETKNIKNLKIKILNKKEIEKENMNLLLAVNSGSFFEPLLLIMEYNYENEKNEKKDKICLIGKGITFDSGGYNLKPSNALNGMKFDMSGGAIVCSAIISLAKIKSKKNISVIVPLTENKIDGKSILTESIIKSMNGKTVQIDNTDAEGRLILADAITYAIKKLNADKIIEISTLTGAILVTLGKHISGVFSNNEEWYQKLVNASNISKEEIWRLPIHKINKENMKKTQIADLTNCNNSRMNGSSDAAAFLCEFVENKPFIHIDIAGTAEDENGRGTGVMIKTLFEMLK